MLAIGGGIILGGLGLLFILGCLVQVANNE